MSTDQDNLAARFLLGKLGEGEASKIEEDCFHSPNLFEDMLAAENDLIDAYAMGRLSAEDRRRFESRLLLNPQQQQRVQFAKTLVKYASSQPLTTAADFHSPAAQSSWISIVSRLFSKKAVFSLSFSAAALILFISVIWLVVNNAGPARRNNQIADVEKPLQSPEQSPAVEVKNANETVDPGPPAAQERVPPAPKSSPVKREKPPAKEPPVFYSLILSPGLTRAAGESRRFAVPANADFVKIRLKLEQGDFSVYHAVLETVEGRQVWSSKLKASKNAAALEILIPSKLFKKADYILALKGATKEGVFERVEDYAFTIYR